MKRTLIVAGMALALVFAGVSCNKYEEGSNFSLLSAKARLSNIWTQASSTYETDVSSTPNTGFTEVAVTFTKDGTYTYTGKFISIPFAESGTWVFNSDKTVVTMTEASGDVESWTLIKLKGKELKVTTPFSSGTLTFDFTGV